MSDPEPKGRRRIRMEEWRRIRQKQKATTMTDKQAEPSDAAIVKHFHRLWPYKVTPFLAECVVELVRDFADRPRLEVSEDMVERVAKAMCDFDGPRPIGYTDWDALARVALAAAAL